MPSGTCCDARCPPFNRGPVELGEGKGALDIGPAPPDPFDDGLEMDARGMADWFGVDVDDL